MTADFVRRRDAAASTLERLLVWIDAAFDVLRNAAATAAFTVADFALLRPLPFPEPNTLIRLVLGPNASSASGVAIPLLERPNPTSEQVHSRFESQLTQRLRLNDDAYLVRYVPLH